MAAVSLTCQACHLLFNNAEEHRTHYRSDLHRLNAKRRAAALVPISQAEFTQRLQELSAAAPAEPAAAEFRCTTCDRVYSSKETLEQHLSTRKHREAQLATGSAAPVTPAPVSAPAANRAAPITAEEEERLVQERLATARRIPANECLFCSHTVQLPSGVAEAVTAHMASVHSFFIPDVEYLADLPGLLGYLAEKAAVGYACFYCPRTFWSLEAVRGHMRDSSHCKIKYDTDEEQDEFAEFYDFSMSELSEGGVSTTPTDGKSDPVQRAHASAAERVQLSDDGFTMQVNGKSIGHRALRVYYRQAAPRQRPAPSETARAITQVVGDYRLLGWRGSDGRPKSEQQARQEKRAQEKAASLALAVGVRQNRIQKNHPRDQTTIF